ncbi:hypothetical protein [Terrabacter sp. Soil810]|uniref:hypothetical protein n=1 Tax=Terrabacter sp. Soil810 TaxID=1736418 RepID=UPI0012F74076|nr:hypothetical protein [Terrabacter sp. Soil810]
MTPQPLPSAVAWQPWELFLFFAGFAVGLAVLIPAYLSCLPRPVAGAQVQDHRTLVEWEKDRVLGAGKGMASVAAGFLIAVVTAALKSELGSVPVWAALGCVAGSIGMLLIAAELSRQSADFARSSLIETLKW